MFSHVAGVEVIWIERPLLANGTRYHLGWSVLLGDVGQQRERGELRPGAIGARHHQVVVAVVPVVLLFVVDGSGVFGPRFDLVEVEVGRAAEPLGSVDEIGVERQAGEVERFERAEP